MSQMRKMQLGGVFEAVDVYICDGGSVDESADSEFIATFGTRALLINTSDKQGQAIQLKQGFFEAMREGYDGVIMVDGNDKDDVCEALPKFLTRLNEGFDLVQATRFRRGGKAINTPILRYLGIRFIASPLISLFSRTLYSDVCNGFKAFSCRLILEPRLAWFSDRFSKYEYCYFPLVHCKKLGFKPCEVPTIRAYPKNEIPSKIKGFSSNLRLLKEIILIAFSKTKKV